MSAACAQHIPDHDERLLMRVKSQTVVLTGDLDITEVAAVRLLLDALDSPGVVDMRDVRYLDSSALHELARVARRVGRHEVTLVVASDNVRRVLNTVQFDQLFTIVDEVQPARGTALGG